MTLVKRNSCQKYVKKLNFQINLHSTNFIIPPSHAFDAPLNVLSACIYVTSYLIMISNKEDGIYKKKQFSRFIALQICIIFKKDKYIEEENSL